MDDASGTDIELEAALDVLTARDGVSREEAVRRAVLAAAAQTGGRTEIDDILDSELPRYADALRRLGE